MDINHDVITFDLNYVFLRRPNVEILANITTIATMFIKEIFKNSK